MSPLAKKVLELERKYPGAASAPMELPAKLWAELVALARAEPQSLRSRVTPTQSVDFSRRKTGGRS